MDKLDYWNNCKESKNTGRRVKLLKLVHFFIIYKSLLNGKQICAVSVTCLN